MSSKVILVVGGIAAIVIVGKIMNDRNGWFDKLIQSTSTSVASVNTKKPKNVATTSREPRGKLPWSVGDVSLWDDEDPNYCGNCAEWCNESYSGAHSTQCDMCMAKCPGVIKD